jgi:hypothetical protein
MILKLMASSSKMSPEAVRPDVFNEGSVFPIPQQVFRDNLRVWDELTPPEKEVVVTGNTDILPDNDPTAYLLRGSARPFMQEEPRRDYGIGVCIAAAALRRHLRHLNRTGHYITPGEFKPEEAPVHHPLLAFGTANYMPTFMRQRMLNAGRISIPVGEVARYIEGDHTIILWGLSRGTVMVEGLPFVSPQQVEFHNISALMLGMADSLRLYYELYGGAQAPVQYKVSDDPLPFLRKSRQDTWPEAGLHQSQDFTQPRGAGQPPDFLLQRRLTPGYRAQIRTTKGGRQTATVMWSNQAPKDARVLRVSRFISAHVATSELSSNNIALEEVGIPGTQEEYVLRPGDTLIARGKNDAFYALGHPFVIDPNIVHEDTQTAELLRLCTFGKSVDLVDRLSLTDEQQAAYDALTQHATYHKSPVHRRMYRFLSRDVGDAVYPPLVAASTAAVTFYPGAKAATEAWNLPPGAAWALAAALGGVLLRICQRQVSQDTRGTRIREQQRSNY